MSNPPSHPAETGKSCGRPLTVVELTVVLEELDRVVAELEDALVELALPFDEPSRSAMHDAITAARRAL